MTTRNESRTKAKTRQLAASAATAVVLASADPASAVSHVGNHVSLPTMSAPEIGASKIKGRLENKSSLPQGAILCYTHQTPAQGVKGFSVASLRSNSLEIDPNSYLSQAVLLPAINEFQNGSRKTSYLLTKQSGIFLHLTYPEMDNLVYRYPSMNEQEQSWLAENPLCGFGGAFVLNGEVYIPRTMINSDNQLQIEHVLIKRQVLRRQYAACHGLRA